MSTIKPISIRLEASSFCQLKCPSCPTASKAIHPAVGSGFLRFNDFKALVEANPFIRQIELSNYGEIFLNNELLKIMELAHERGITLRAFNGVNFNNVKDEVLEALVKYRFEGMTCSIDGASQETYKIYRVNGNYDTVIANIRKLNEYKAKYNSKYPLLNWQFVVFGHNEHEIPVARELAKELGMTFHLKLSWDDDFSPIRDKEFVRAQVGSASRDEYEEENGVAYKNDICHQLWERPQINWDGKVLGCCRNFWGDFGGNAFKEGFLNSVNSEKMRYARQMLMGKAEARKDIPCTHCELYHKMKASGNWVNRSPLAQAQKKALTQIKRIIPSSLKARLMAARSLATAHRKS